MHLIIFDIDGTLIHSHQQELDCFEQALKEITGIEGVAKDLQSYQHVTDSGITQECIQRHLNRPADLSEIHAVESRFIELFERCLSDYPILPIAGIHYLLDTLKSIEDVKLCVATGCCYKAAILKLEHAQLPLVNFPIASSNDSHERTKIMQSAHQKAKSAYQTQQFDSIVYVGDGPWDIQATSDLAWDFIAIASNYSENQLTSWGAKRILPHYLPHDNFLNYVNELWKQA